MSESVPADLVEVGRVSRAHGIRGHLKVQHYSSDGLALLNTSGWWFRPGTHDSSVQACERIEVRSCSSMGAGFIRVKLAGINDRDAASALHGHTIWLPRSSFPPVADNEFYWVDLMGCALYGLDAGAQVMLGLVTHVMDNGAHAVLYARPGAMDDAGRFHPATAASREILVPFVDAHILDVDLQARRIVTNWPAGF